ncbi:winged helix-turn-helix domain-containing protein [Streptomyces sp. NPDC059637]|uniref:winged helix-turn-helix domain-containing protein n=1 Tax=Streptomyces sp. NPDC059637 TaxID=3347752 RepID=UPI00367B44BF
MLTAHFTHEDIARTHMAPSAHPMAEAVFALDLLVSSLNRCRPGRWAAHARAWAAARPFLHLELRRIRRSEERLLPVLLEAEGPARAADGQKETRRALSVLSEFQKAVVDPFWPSAHRLLLDTRKSCTHTLAHRGLAAVLESVGGTAGWSEGTLTVSGGEDREVFLDGRGVELMPSVFLSGGPRLYRWYDRTSGRRRAVLVFPVCPHGRATEALAKETRPQGGSLPQLLGRTRAAVLSQLTRPQSTSQLSAALRISVTTASEHTSVLRSTGLITTTRNGSSVRHEVTRLGELVLNPPAPPLSTWCTECAERAARAGHGGPDGPGGREGRGGFGGREGPNRTGREAAGHAMSNTQ